MMLKSAVIFALTLFQMTALAQPSTGEFYSFRLQPHEDLRQGVLKFAVEKKIKAGAIITCVGSLERINIRFANQESAHSANGFHEVVSLVGTFSDQSSHIHLSVSDSTGQTIGGHLLDGNLIYTTAEIVIVDLKDLEFGRETDATYGYQELIVRKKKKP